jgi:O-antigen/teichoic acid export membrane protein
MGMSFGGVKNFLFVNKSEGQTVVKNTVWLFVSQVASRVIRAGLIIYAARVLGAFEYGAFSYALSLAALFTVFIDFGINALITRESTRELDLQEKYFSTALVVKLVLFAIIAGILIALRPLFIHQAGVGPLIPLIILVIGFDSLRDFAASLSRAWEKMEIEAGVQIATNVFIVAAGVIAILTAPHSFPLLLAYAIGTGLGMVIAFYPFRRYLTNLAHTFSRALIKPIFTASWPYGMVALMGGVLLNTDSLMVGWLRGTADVGYYAAGIRITQLLYIIPYPLVSALFPPLARAIQDKERFRALLERTSAVLVLAAIPLTIGGVVFAKPIIQLLYSSSYERAAIAFAIANLTFIPVFLSNSFGNAVFALNKERKLFTYIIIGIVGNIILDLILIPFFGIAGSSLATLINQIIITAYLIFVLRTEVKFRLAPEIWKLFGAAALMLAVSIGCAALHLHVIIALIVSAIVYGGALLLLRERTAVELKNGLQGLRAPSVQ